MVKPVGAKTMSIGLEHPRAVVASESGNSRRGRVLWRGRPRCYSGAERCWLRLASDDS